MYKYILLIFTFLLSSAANASNFLEDNQITAEKNCFSGFTASHDSWRDVMRKKFEKRAKTPAEAKKRLARFDRNFTKAKFDSYKHNLDCSRFTYTVDSVPVQGFVIKPKSSGKKLPVLVYNRGGNGRYGTVLFGPMMSSLFPIAEEGFIIIGSQYRGSFTKADALDEFGGKDVSDVTSLLEHIASIKDADPNRIGMYGASRGGMQTHMAMRQVNNVKAIATIAGQTDLSFGLTIRPAMERVYKHRIPNYESNKQAELEKRSVATWVDELSPQVPILLIHGTEDKRVSVKHSIALADELSKQKIPHKLVLYQGDNHGVWKHRQQMNQELVAWFKEYL